MRFDKVLNEIFSLKGLDDKDYYKDNQERKKNLPDRYEPKIVVPDVNKTTSTGALKKKKK